MSVGKGVRPGCRQIMDREAVIEQWTVSNRLHRTRTRTPHNGYITQTHSEEVKKLPGIGGAVTRTKMEFPALIEGHLCS